MIPITKVNSTKNSYNDSTNIKDSYYPKKCRNPPWEVYVTRSWT